MGNSQDYKISYGKSKVPVYRVFATPLSGIKAVPESDFKGRSNNLFAYEVDVEVLGNNFLPAYTEGDNSNVVATDSMKNFIIKQGLAYTGSTLEGYLDFLGKNFLSTYSQMEELSLTGRELAFESIMVPDQVENFKESGVLFKRSHNDYSLATLKYVREGEQVVMTDHICGRINLELLKVTGSSFTRFVRDGYTTLPERSDRPLYIKLDIYWKYNDPLNLLNSSIIDYVTSEQIRDLAQTTFHQFESESIQHLINEIGKRTLKRFPQIGEVIFEAQNLTPDPIAVSDQDPKVKVYSAPFPAFGLIKLALTRSKIESE